MFLIIALSTWHGNFNFHTRSGIPDILRFLLQQLLQPAPDILLPTIFLPLPISQKATFHDRRHFCPPQKIIGLICLPACDFPDQSPANFPAGSSQQPLLPGNGWVIKHLRSMNFRIFIAVLMDTHCKDRFHLVGSSSLLPAYLLSFYFRLLLFQALYPLFL